MNSQLYSPIAISVREAAQRLGLGRTKIYELMQSGELQSRTVGRRRLISMASVAAMLDQPTNEGGINA